MLLEYFHPVVTFPRFNIEITVLASPATGRRLNVSPSKSLSSSPYE